MLRPTIFASAVAALWLVPAAAAHVTVNPDSATADSFTRFAIRVPTERPNAATVSITVRLPRGLFFVSFQPKAGWKRTTKIEKLATPVEVFGQQIDERVAEVTWTGGRIEPGEFDEFGLSAKLPDAAGTQLVFPALQRYSSGEVVRWIGPPDADEPASRVALAPAESEAQRAAPAQRADDETREDAALGISLGALAAALGALGLTLWRGRRT